jgi:DNA-binding transcriptional MerR regulator
MSTHVTAHSYTIKEASHLTGLPASTLRYYESIGIIDPVERGVSSKQRVYNEDDLNVLMTVACLNATGMPIEDMRTYVQNVKHSLENVDEQISLLSTQKKQLASESTLLKVRQQYVDLKIDYWKALEAGNQANVQQITAQARKLASILMASKQK